MDPTITSNLQTAYALIKVGRQHDALDIIVPIVKQNPNLAEAWYLLGFSLTDPQKQLQAFKQTLRIDPNNLAAKKQVDRLLAAAYLDPSATRPLPMPVPLVPPPAAAESPKPAAAPAQPPPKKKSNLMLWLLISILVVVLGLLGYIIWWTTTTGRPAAEAFLPLVGRPRPSIPSGTASPPKPMAIPSPTPAFRAVFRSAACPFDIPPGRQVRCGVVKVPQNRAKNFTDLLELPVVVYQSTKPSDQAVFYLQDGPGVAGIAWAVAHYDAYVVPMLEEYDLVVFDARGTGRSTPTLDCPALNALFSDAYFQKRPQEEAFNQFLSAWVSCRNRLTAAGIDPAAFNTAQPAADVADRVTALGYQQVNLFGVGYGARVGLTVMRDHPELVRAAVLDSPVLPEVRMFNRAAADAEYAIQKVFADCASSPRCNKAYPNLESVFKQLAQRFERDPLTITVRDPASGFTDTVTVNGANMLSALVWGLYHSDLTPFVPKALYDLQKGDTTFLEFALGAPGGQFHAQSWGTYFATVCPEQIAASTAQELDTDLNSAPALKGFALAGLFGSSERAFQVCMLWNARAYDPRDSEPIKADIPSMIISGEYDPSTSAITGQMLAADLPNHHFYIAPGLGHQASANRCVLDMTRDFLRDPARAPDSACLDALQSYDFFLPYTGAALETVEVSDPGLNLKSMIPSKWQKRSASGFYFRANYLFDATQVGFISLFAPKDSVLETLTAGFENIGFEKMPRKVSNRTANGFSWTLYEGRFNGDPVLVALAQDNSRTIGIILVASAAEKEAFYRGLFLPMIDALTPLK
jgi:pimeloyl-ACP methyl ester carboxylesterase